MRTAKTATAQSAAACAGLAKVRNARVDKLLMSIDEAVGVEVARACHAVEAFKINRPADVSESEFDALINLLLFRLKELDYEAFFNRGDSTLDVRWPEACNGGGS
jgi:hypothetical protein